MGSCYTYGLDYAYTYGDSRSLYLNVTNRCTNRCSFCVRYYAEGLGGALLRGEDEPDLEMLEGAVRSHGPFEEIREFIWCGYGEPTFRLDLMREAAPWLRSAGAKIRLNTNGHARLIHGRDVLPEIAETVDDVSVSLNAPDCRKYVELSRPDPRIFAVSQREAMRPELAWEAMIDFLSRAPGYFPKAQASVVGFALTGEEIESCRRLALSLGIKHFKVR
ncbi:MAG TPA: TatD family nuclease-associated radical SAM protein [Acidobacteriota bacterium]|nr:TatD family nuclease-associated radical SAM protein [Acidobacteriota bacterium]